MVKLVRKQHSKDGVISHVVYSDCGAYRYSLTRSWDRARPHCLWIMLNPSTADAHRNDPTVERCERRARTMGFGAFRVVNIFGFRATDPTDLRKAHVPVGPSNDRVVLRSVTGWAGGPDDIVLCGWGAHGSHRDRAAQLTSKLRRTGRPLHHLGLTAAGHPRHPLYVSYEQLPMLWSPDAPVGINT